MYDTILVPTDGSLGTESVAAEAAALAAATDATVHAVYVIDESAVPADGDAPAEEVRETMSEAGEDAVDAVADVASERGVEVTDDVREGVVHEEILSAAEDVDADLVVMGTHGRSGVERYLLGSTTEQVVRLAERPVMAVKLAEQAVASADEAEAVAADVLADEGDPLDSLRDEPYRERSTWVVPVRTADGRAVNVHVDAESGDASVAHLD